MLLSVITGTFNRLPYLTAMIESARRSMPKGISYEFVVCDGGSTDGTLEYLANQPDIVVVRHTELKGAIKAFNDAAAAAKGDYLIPSNDDIEFVGFTIARGLAHMMDNPDIGAGCFYQDRSGKDWHVEAMPIYYPGEPEARWEPYMQVGIIPKWLWDKCDGWGNWGGRTYGGDNYLSAKVYESGYKVVPIEGCKIHDKTPLDELRRVNNDHRHPDQNLWQTFPQGFHVSTTPIYENPLVSEFKRVLYAPIIEAGHDVQKEQKKGLREALKALGLVWEVDYQYSGESVADAAEAWTPHYVITQFHVAQNTSLADVRRIKTACQGYMVNWNGDVWPNQANPEMMEILRHYDYHLTVNASLLPKYEAVGIRAAYWQNAYEPTLLTGREDPPRDIDVIFLGNNYTEDRLKLAKWINTLPCKAAVYGSGYPEGVASGQSLYNFQKTGELYRTAKMAIGDNQFWEATAFCSDRTFMILAAGGCMLLQQKVDQIEQYLGLIPGVHFVEWTDKDDLKAKIAYYLEHEDERERIAAAGTWEARAKHTFANRVEELKGLLKGVPRQAPKVSAMMIVKNESWNIQACLDQLEWADEIVIVDTGSADGTLVALNGGPLPVMQLLHPDGAAVADESLLFRRGSLSVYQYGWDDDFSAARNFAKSKCTGDWVFFIDADERLTADTARRLKEFGTWTFRKLGVTNPGAFRFMVQDVRDGVRGQAGFQTRLFKNLPKLEFRSALHESVDASIEELGITTIAQSVLQIDHLGSSDFRVTRYKQERNLHILNKMNPSPWRDYQKAVSYAAMQRWGDAIVWAEIAEAGTPEPEFKAYLAFLVGYAFEQMGLKDLALRKLRTTDFADALYLRAELEEGFQAELYRKFLKTPLPTLFPTFCLAWKPKAKEALMAWHQAELQAIGV